MADPSESRALEPYDQDETAVYPSDTPPDHGCSRESRIGTRIGPYRIVQRIAEGGMGTVYLAEREDHFKQRVALKTLHPEKVSDTLLQRFYAERQILADLEHPHIARIFDGGAGQGSLPFFVMEYVEGEPFDIACAALPLRQKLTLFQKVCDAVHHAHRSLIVHRDLKPSNILVTADGEPKLLDFGIAKLLDPERQGLARSAGPPGQGPMTIAFASPEQLDGGPITIGTDIYSLGVLLYLVLSGRHPHHRSGQSLTDLMQAIRCEHPVNPSLVADHGLGDRLAGDLDAIALKALSKRPEDRYDSTAQLAEEIQLHLDDLPIRAWRGTWLGRLRKSARRNKLAVVFPLLLLSFSTVVTGLWLHAVDQQVQAKRAQTRAEKTRDFILDFFESIEPDRSLGPGIDVKIILDSGRRKLEKALRDEPEVRADLLGTMAVIYHGLALYDEALLLQEETVRHRRALRPLDTRKLAVDLNNLATSYYSREEFGKAEPLFRESLQLWRELGDPYEVSALANLAATLGRQDKAKQAMEIYGQALDRSVALSLENDPNTAGIFYGLGALHKRLGELSASERHLRRALSTYSLHADTKPSRTAQVQSSLGEVLHALGRHAEARPYLEAALSTRLRVFGERHTKTAGSQKKLGLLLVDLGELDDAEVLLKQAGGTYSTLGDEAGAAEVREALGRLAD